MVAELQLVALVARVARQRADRRIPPVLRARLVRVPVAQEPLRLAALVGPVASVRQVAAMAQRPVVAVAVLATRLPVLALAVRSYSNTHEALKWQLTQNSTHCPLTLRSCNA